MIRLLAPVAICATLATASLAADDASGKAQAAAERLREASAALDGATGARDRVRALTDTIRAYEDGLGALRDALRDTAVRERAIRDRLDRESDRLSRVLAALQTIERSPEVTLLLHPSGATATARAAMLMSDVVPALRSEVTRLRTELDELRVLTLLRRDAVGTLEEGLEGAHRARTELSQAMSERTEPPDPMGTNAAALQALLDGAETLDAFATSLTGDIPATGSGDEAGFEAAKGSLALPVSGSLVSGFRQPDAAGIRRPGLVLATAARSLVTAPWPSTVRYVGPLLDYGNVIILEPEDGYLLVLAGLGDAFGAVGDVVGAGDPLGLMGGRSPAAQEILIESSDGSGQARTETLYMELRTGDGPVDPSDWFALGRE